MCWINGEMVPRDVPGYCGQPWAGRWRLLVSTVLSSRPPVAVWGASPPVDGSLRPCPRDLAAGAGTLPRTLTPWNMSFEISKLAKCCGNDSNSSLSKEICKNNSKKNVCQCSQTAGRNSCSIVSGDVSNCSYRLTVHFVTSSRLSSA